MITAPEVTTQKSTKIDINTILQYANVSIALMYIFSFVKYGGNQFVDLHTILYGLVLSIQISGFLLFEKKRRDPFVIILCFQMVFFYLLRILTLSIYSFSFVFDRYPFTASDLNNAILFIILANLALYAGIYPNKVKQSTTPADGTIAPRKPQTLLYVLLFTYLMTYTSGPMAGVVGIINSLFINVAVIMFMIIIYVTMFFNKINNLTKTALIVGLIIYVVIATVSGSRSAVITLAYFCLFTSLAIYNNLKIKRLYLVLFMFLVPVLVAFFTVATYLRPRLENRASVGGETFAVLKEFDFKETFTNNAELILSPIFGRIGFLDFCAEIIANEKHYSSVFNFKYYAESIIDNDLTPGFDIFDTPKTSNAISFIYYNAGVPKKTKVADAYQSDEFTFFGEMYALMGRWFSVIPIFLISFAFKRLYVKIADENKFRFYAKRGFILYVFFNLLNSFGLDWVLFDTIGVLFTYVLFKSFFKLVNLQGSVSISD